MSIGLIAFTLGVIVASIIIDRGLQNRQKQFVTRHQKRAGLGLKPPKRSLWARITRKGVIDLPKEFKSWGRENLADFPDLYDWLNTLSTERLAVFVSQLNDFCMDSGINLAWLVTGQLHSDPHLEAEARRVVAAYSTAYWQAIQGKTGFELFNTFYSFQQDPMNKIYREFSQQLYLDLVDAQLVDPPTISEAFFMSDRKRHKQVVSAINQAAKDNRQAFNQVLQSALTHTQAESQQREQARHLGSGRGNDNNI